MTRSDAYFRTMTGQHLFQPLHPRHQGCTNGWNELGTIFSFSGKLIIAALSTLSVGGAIRV
jgi:hypothetical protein